MGLGRIIRATAFEVAPRQVEGFGGGLVEHVDQLADGLERADELAAVDRGVAVTLRFDQSRKSQVRELLRNIAFDKPSAALDSAEALAKRLGESMGNRSDASLQVVSVHQLPGGDRLVVWLFPREPVIQRTGNRVDVNDAFSLSSKLRKAAYFDGAKDEKTGFMNGRIVDFQLTSSDKTVTEFWVRRFLDASIQMTSKAGTKLIAKVLKDANERLSDDLDEQLKLHTAIGVLRNRGRPMSIEEVSKHLLTAGPARDAVLAALKNDDERNAVFTLDTTLFDALIQFCVYRLKNGLVVSAPFHDSSDDLRIESTEHGQRLTTSGFVESEKLGTRQI